MAPPRYMATMFRRLVASEHVDWVVMDSNFRVRGLLVMSHSQWAKAYDFCNSGGAASCPSTAQGFGPAVSATLVH